MKASKVTGSPSKTFSPPLKNQSQKLAWKQWPEVDLMFLIGPAGTGKTHAASVLAMREIHSQRASKIILVGQQSRRQENSLDSFQVKSATNLDRILGQSKTRSKRYVP
jgi:predicted ribonuclease YlaK